MVSRFKLSRETKLLPDMNLLGRTSPDKDAASAMQEEPKILIVGEGDKY